MNPKKLFITALCVVCLFIAALSFVDYIKTDELQSMNFFLIFILFAVVCFCFRIIVEKDEEIDKLKKDKYYYYNKSREELSDKIEKVLKKDTSIL